MPRTVLSKVRVALPAREVWRLRCDFTLEQHIASLNKRKISLVEEEAIHEGAENEQRQRLVRCDLVGDHLNGGVMGVKTGSRGTHAKVDKKIEILPGAVGHVRELLQSGIVKLQFADVLGLVSVDYKNAESR